MTYSLNDKVVLITGAAGGIGAATARALFEQGARLVLTDLRQADVDALAAEFDAARVLALALDVTDMRASRQAVADAVRRFGRLDVVFANAGIAWDPPKTVLTVDDAEFEKIVEVDLLGVWRTVKAALPEIVKNRGQVLTTSSIYAFMNGTINAPYAMSKAGVESFTRALRTELAGSGASASVLYPGWVKTPMTELAFGGNATVTRFLEALLPKPLRTLVAPETIATDVVKGLKERAPRIISPSRWAVASLLRGVVISAFDRKLDTDETVREVVRQIEQDSQQSRGNKRKAA